MTGRQVPEVERLLSSIRARVLEEVERSGITHEQLAERLGILPVGAEVMLARAGSWTMESAIEVACAVGLEVGVVVSGRGDDDEARRRLAKDALDGNPDALVVLVEGAIRRRLDAQAKFEEGVFGAMSALAKRLAGFSPVLGRCEVDGASGPAEEAF